MRLETIGACLWPAPPDHAAHDERHLIDDAHLADGPQAAAVLVPLVLRPEPTILFTRRTETLARHSGQVSFPGGRREPHDRSPAETALRETMEETGIVPGLVRVAGFLDRYLTGTGFDIQPVVGLVAPDFILAPNPAEVAGIFEVPLAFFLAPANLGRETRLLGGRARDIFTFRHDGHEIWGATAAILLDLVRRLHDIEAP